MPTRVFLRGLVSAPAARTARIGRVLSIGLLAGAILLTSTLPAGAAEVESENGTRSALHAFLEAVGQLGARLAIGKDLPDEAVAGNVVTGNVVTGNVVTGNVVTGKEAPAKGAPGKRAPGKGAAEQAGATRAAVEKGEQKVPTVPAIQASTKAKSNKCRNAGRGEVPKVVAAIFRCHLRKAGFSEAEVGQFVAEAVVVSKCESYWDPKIVVFDGKYLHQAHPRTGYRYSAAGVFQFIRATADKWIDGGYANVKKPRRNVDAAARLFIHNRTSGLKGWEDWACAAANDGFKQGSVLPNYPGGPSAMPAWSWKY